MRGVPLNVVDAREVELRHGSRPALVGVTLAVPAGTVTAVIGPNGSGKSTLLDALVGLLEPFSGSLAVLGRPPREVRRRIAYVPQSTRFHREIPITVREAVGLGRYATLGRRRRFRVEDRRRVAEAMERLDILDLGRRHLSELSGGQRQRVFVAQGLAQERDVLLLDEPVTGLDLTSSAIIAAVIGEEKEAGRSVIFTTHDLADAAGADVVVLLAGRVVAAGPPADVLTPAHLGEAYGLRVAPLVDDAAHWPVDRGGRSAVEAG